MTLVAPRPTANLPHTPYFLAKSLSPFVEPVCAPESDRRELADLRELALPPPPPPRERMGALRRSRRLKRLGAAAEGGGDGEDWSWSERVLVKSSEA